MAVFAANLLTRQKKLPKPDLASHTLIHFLDKFVYRNAKATDSKRGGSIMQPVLASGGAVGSGKAASRQSVVNSASFWNLPAEKVSAEDTFFHEYFARIGKPGQVAKTKKAAKEQAGSDDEEAEGEIWEALVNSRPEVEGADVDDESDFDMEDYEDSDEDLDLDAAGDGGHGQDSEDSGDDFQGIFDDSEGDDDDDDEAVGEEEEAAVDGEGGDAEAISKNERNIANRKRRKAMKALPTFASAEDYADMLAAEDGGLDDQ